MAYEAMLQARRHVALPKQYNALEVIPNGMAQEQVWSAKELKAEIEKLYLLSMLRRTNLEGQERPS